MFTSWSAEASLKRIGGARLRCVRSRAGRETQLLSVLGRGKASPCPTLEEGAVNHAPTFEWSTDATQSRPYPYPYPLTPIPHPL